MTRLIIDMNSFSIATYIGKIINLKECITCCSFSFKREKNNHRQAKSFKYYTKVYKSYINYKQKSV